MFTIAKLTQIELYLKHVLMKLIWKYWEYEEYGNQFPL